MSFLIIICKGAVLHASAGPKVESLMSDRINQPFRSMADNDASSMYYLAYSLIAERVLRSMDKPRPSVSFSDAVFDGPDTLAHLQSPAPSA